MKRKKRNKAKPIDEQSENPVSSIPPEPKKNGLLVVAIGASAGGLEAFTELLSHLPTDTGMAVVLVQHLDPRHESILTELVSHSTIPVREVKDGMRIEANHIYVIPPNTTMIIENETLRLTKREKFHGQHMAVDLLMRSLAEAKGNKAIGVILSGTGSDGTLGLAEIQAQGGVTFAQDQTARYDGMPRSAIAGGYVDFVLSPAEIARELARIAQHPYVAHLATADTRQIRIRLERGAQNQHISFIEDYSVGSQGSRISSRSFPL